MLLSAGNPTYNPSPAAAPRPVYGPQTPCGCSGCPNCKGALGNTTSGLGNTHSGLGDLSFDGTGLFGTGLFGYTPWYDTSQWTVVEWAAAAAVVYYGWQLVSSVRSSVSSASSRRSRRRKAYADFMAI